MVIKHHRDNKNLLVMVVLICAIVCTTYCFSFIPHPNFGINVGTQQKAPIAMPLLPPQTVEVHQPPTPHPVATHAPKPTIPTHPEPAPAPDFHT